MKILKHKGVQYRPHNLKWNPRRFRSGYKFSKMKSYTIISLVMSFTICSDPCDCIIFILNLPHPLVQESRPVATAARGNAPEAAPGSGGDGLGQCAETAPPPKVQTGNTNGPEGKNVAENPASALAKPKLARRPLTRQDGGCMFSKCILRYWFWFWF